MTGKQHFAHIWSVILTSIVALLTPALLPGGALAHYSWAPLALAAVVYAVRVFNLGAGPPAALVLLVLGLASCGITGPAPPPGTPGIVNCSEAALHAAALNILPSVETALTTDSYEAALATLIASVGGPLAVAEVECAVEWVANNAALQETATGDPLEAAKATRARTWLAAHPVTFQ